MKSLFMIGNGFDINCGLKTSYRDIINQYIKTESKTDVIAQYKKDIEKDLDTWGDFEFAMAKYAKTVGRESLFLECLNDFSVFMADYLRKEEEDFLRNLNGNPVNPIVKEMDRSLNSFYEDITNNVTRFFENEVGMYKGVWFLTFNYTSVLEKLLGLSYNGAPVRMPNVIHIHGSINDAVLGMDNADQIDLDYEMSDRFMRHFIKPYFNEKYDSQRVSDATYQIYKADVICVYGMSLGVSDLMWREKIITWLKANSTHHLIYYSYIESIKTFDLVHDRMDSEEAAKTRILNEWNVENPDEIREQIHIPCGKNIFNIGEVIDQV